MFNVTLTKAYGGLTTKGVNSARAVVLVDGNGSVSLESLQVDANHYGASVSLLFNAADLVGVTLATIKASLPVLIESKLNADGTLK